MICKKFLKYFSSHASLNQRSPKGRAPEERELVERQPWMGVRLPARFMHLRLFSLSQRNILGALDSFSLPDKSEPRSEEPTRTPHL